MDDLKLYAPHAAGLGRLLDITCDFSSRIRMKLGVDKCAVLHVERGRIVSSDRLPVSDGISLRVLSEGETHRYLGMSQNIGIDVAVVKQAACDVFYERLTKVCKSLLSGVNKTRAFNGWVMPVLLYTFGMLRWTQTELDALVRKVHSIMTLHRMLHPKSSVMRLYILRKCGGLSAKVMHSSGVCSLREYFLSRADSVMHREVMECDKGLTPLALARDGWKSPAVLSTSDREAIWKGKELHGRFFHALHEPQVDKEASVHWLRFGDSVTSLGKPRVLSVQYRIRLSGRTTIGSTLCRRPGESLRHVTSGCSMFANTEYLDRHNQAARILHQELALKYGLIEQRLPYYKYQPPYSTPYSQTTAPSSTGTGPSSRTIFANKPDIVLMD